MSYNLQSLITILQQLLNSKKTHWIVTDNETSNIFVTKYKPQLLSLLQKAASLQKILENSSFPIIESLESRIRDEAYYTENIIEFNMVNHVLSCYGENVFTLPAPDLYLQQVMEGFDSVTEQVREILLEGLKSKKISATGSSSSTGAEFLLSSDPPTSKTDVLVGHHEDLSQLKDRLMGYESKLEIVPIYGMGGIGKTTLARTLYEDPLTVSHFDVRAWATISHDYNVRDILLSLLCRPNEKLSRELTELPDIKLKEILHKMLFRRRYFIVLDDMWSTDCWDAIKSCFPDHNDESRILVTTRGLDVANDVGTKGCQHKVELLKESESWKLLCHIVFGEEENCPDIAALQGIGRKIAGDCGGLPLAVNVIGGLLSKVERSIDVWESIGEDVSAAIAEADDGGFSNVLSLSYNHLPNHLKPCFLYLGAFPEDFMIKGSRLIRMMVADGLVKSNGYKSSEEAEAEAYMEALVERNLVVVTRKKSNGKSLEYGMHDLLMDLCTRKAREEKFLHAKNQRFEGLLYNIRRMSVHTHTSYIMDDMLSMPFVRSFLCFVRFEVSPGKTLSPVFMAARLVRVLDVFTTEFAQFPSKILLLVNLRFLAISCRTGGLPEEISRLLNLQTLIAKIYGKRRVPEEIWHIPGLRYLWLDQRICINYEWKKFERLINLQVISSVRYDDQLIQRGFLESITEIEKMTISLTKVVDRPLDLTHLHKLQTLNCHSEFSSKPEFGIAGGRVSVFKSRYRKLNGKGRFSLYTAKFPCSLRKLTLKRLVINPAVLTTLCALQHLEVLKIFECEFINEVFEATEEGDVFRSLQSLLLRRMKDLVRWRADENNFPRLRHLTIYECPSLEEIPSDIGDIPTLQLIEVDRFSPGAMASAIEIQKVQQDLENYDLHVVISD